MSETLFQEDHDSYALDTITMGGVRARKEPHITIHFYRPNASFITAIYLDEKEALRLGHALIKRVTE